MTGESEPLVSPTPLPPTPLPPTIGGYEILRRLGGGGMGIVYEGRQKQPQRRVAIKVAKAGSLDERGRFELEAQCLARLRHPGIVQIIEAGTTVADSDAGAVPFFVMELVEGQPLTRYAATHLSTVRAKLELFAAVCDAVGYAHRHGVVHRDLKPDNVWIDAAGRPRVLDFGVAKLVAPGRLSATSPRTQAGEVLGTPAYVAPEQLGTKSDAVGPAADVYSLGVMAYELLTGRLPHELDAVPLTEAVAVVAGAEAPRLGVVRPDLRGDLEAVVAKALEKDARRRYADADALKHDIERFLRNEPVVAKRHSTLHRARKFARRHRGFVAGVATATLTLLLGLATTLLFLARSERKVREFDQLAILTRYASAVARVEQFYPPYADRMMPDKIDAMELWLRDDCAGLLATRPVLARTVAELRARALPWTEDERRHDRETHAQFVAWQRLGERLEAERHAQRVRTGTAQLVVPELAAWQQRWHGDMLLELARERCAPTPKERHVYGEEALGLAYARAAVAKVDPTRKCHALEVLALALVCNGQDAAANAAAAETVAECPDAMHTAHANLMQSLEAIAAGLPALEAEYAKLTRDVHGRRTWSFAPGDEASRFLHDSLSRALGSLDLLETHAKATVEELLRWARATRGFSKQGHPNARVSWPAARAAIAKADGIVASTLYAGKDIELRDADVVGLVPLGMNPVTKLWEFYDLRSAWDPRADPATITVPKHRSDGSIEVTAETGIVFVLLPGGTVTLGAQRYDPGQPTYDESAADDETPHEVTLAPFFIARHELTQAQWARLMTWDEGQREPSLHGGPLYRCHPVERVPWSVCDPLVRRHAMMLPTEAQWEYACRAGTSTPWCFGDNRRRMRGYGNVLDRTGARIEPLWGRPEPYEDRFPTHAPVASFRPNAFGLYDMHGNVWEWCRDQPGDYGSEQPGDGRRPAKLVPGASGDLFPSEYYINRGGGFATAAVHARSARRLNSHEAMAISQVGLRCARRTTRAE